MIDTDLQTEDLTEQQWQIAHAIAQSLTKDGTDVNELGKAIAYLRSIQRQPDASDRFFKYLKTLVSHGKQVAYSGRTQDYYRSLERTCSAHLHKSLAPLTLLSVLSWAARLVRYYKSTPVGEWSERGNSPKTIASKPPVIESKRQQEIKTATQSQSIKIGQILDATITSIKGKEVTYLMLEAVKLTVKEPKKADSLTVGQTVKVQVTELRDNQIPKKVKLVEEA